MVRHRYRRDRISVISGLSISPVRHRVGLYYRFHRQNIDGQGVCDFLRHLLRHLRGAPELNADEGVWSLAKATLANGRPDTIDELDAHLDDALQQLGRSSPKLRSCVHRAGLPFF